jgi:hypothetical protein
MDRLTSDAHESDWRLHHISLPASPGDFTPVRRPGYHEEEHSVAETLAEVLTALISGSSGTRPGEPEREAG